jgi:hypothetical protein
MTLRPLETDGWPSFLTRLGLSENHAYAVLLQAPPRHPIDFRTPQSAVRSLNENMGDLLSLLSAKTQIGHVMVAWQCATGRGFASVTGDTGNRATSMVMFDGWGVTPMLSVYTDGRVDGASRVPVGIAAAIAGGKGNVLAVEISEEGCQQLRSFVALYLSDPGHPSRRYGLLLRPDKFEGAGCMSFALEVARRAGVFGGERSVFRRTLDVPLSIVGRRRSVPDGVEAFVQATSDDDQRFVSAHRLVNGPWDGDDGYVSVTLEDPELFFAAVTSLRGDPHEDWRRRRALPESDPAVARAVRHIERWAKVFARRRIADPGGMSALVLESR